MIAKKFIGAEITELWADPKVKEEFGQIRKGLQEVLNEWADRDGKKHIPVYISNKPKVKLSGLYFEKGKTGGAITLFPVRAEAYKPINAILDFDELVTIMKDSYAKHLAR